MQVCSAVGHEPPQVGASLLSHDGGPGSVVVVVVGPPPHEVRQDAKSVAHSLAPLRAAATQPPRQPA
jgi:hypothetical protein